MKALKEYIQNSWKDARTTASETDLDLPYPFIPPCVVGDFRTLFYWDTYFTNIGLILDGHSDWAKENVDNLLYALNHFGCVPNYTRKDGADFCSQPPLLSLMVKDIYEVTKDEEWLKNAVASLEKEYEFWMTKRITPIGLNQHGSNASDELLLGYYDYATARVELSPTASQEEKIRVARNLVSIAESGEDYNSRYQDFNAQNYVQIDLNSHLYGLENFLYEYFAQRDGAKAAFYKEKRDTRVRLLDKYCFNEKTGTYCDYDFVSDKQSDILCGACFLPYFYGFARKDGDISRLYQTLKTKGGVVACQDVGKRILQWDYPYIWPPQQFFAYKALCNYGKTDEAEEVRQNYMQLLGSVFERTGALWERYDENGEAKDLEYPTQRMLGWTAGVYRYFQELENKKG